MFAVYPDRVVVTRRRYLTAVTTVHPIAHIAHLAIRGAPARLHILMDDGSAATYALVGHVAAAHDAITRLRQGVRVDRASRSFAANGAARSPVAKSSWSHRTGHLVRLGTTAAPVR